MASNKIPLNTKECFQVINLLTFVLLLNKDLSILYPLVSSVCYIQNNTLNWIYLTDVRE